MERNENKRRREKRSGSDDYEKERPVKRRSRSIAPKESDDRSSRRKRRYSTSPKDGDRQQKRKNEPPKEANKPEAPVRKAKETDMLNTRTGGAYIPPARLRMMQAQITDKSSIAYQRLAWEALKKSIHGYINKINVGNIGIIIKELLKENIVRGRGLLCRSVIQAQSASPTFTNVYAALVAAVNSRFPNIGELLLKRLVIQFKRGFKRNDKATCISSVSFVAHLVNQKVAHEILALEILTLLVESPTDDSVEVAIAFLKECGQKLTEVSSKGVNAIFEMLRNILHEGQLDKRVQYMIEVMFQVWKDGFKDHPAVIEELELVPEEEQFTHLLMLDDATNAQDILNVFKFDEKYEENEQKYKSLSNEILGSDAESGEDGSEGSGSEESEEEEEKKDVTIIDNTETNLVALRRTIYLTINSSLDFEECAHKLMKMQLKPGQEIELCHMFLDCCAEQRTYEKFYGLLAQRFCNINRIYIGPFEEIFKDSYGTAHRLDTNRLRNVSKFFAHLLFTDSISWEVLESVKLNEEDTTSSSRIYIKILFQELAEYMGLKKLNDRLRDPTLQEAFSGIFPRDNPKNTRFSINFFTSIGLGGLTDELREHLKQMPKNVPPPVTEINLDSDSSSSDSSSSSSSSDDSSSGTSSSDSDEERETESNKKKKKLRPKTPDPEEIPKEKEKAERWGHDGFYDTYGQGARRMETNRTERDNRARDSDRDRRFDQTVNGSHFNHNAHREDNIRNDEDKRRNYEVIRDKSKKYGDERESMQNIGRPRARGEPQTSHNGEHRKDRDRRDREENKGQRNNDENRKDQRRDEYEHTKRYTGDIRKEKYAKDSEIRDRRKEKQFSDDDDRRDMGKSRQTENHQDYDRDKHFDGRREKRINDRETDRRKEKGISGDDERRDINKNRQREKYSSDDEKDKNRENRSVTRREKQVNDDEVSRERRDWRKEKHINEDVKRDMGKSRRVKDISDEDESQDKRVDRRKENTDKIVDKSKEKCTDRHRNKQSSEQTNKRKDRRRQKSVSDEDEKHEKPRKPSNSKSESKKDKKKYKESEGDSGRDSESEIESRKRRKDRKKKKSKENEGELGGRYWDAYDKGKRTPSADIFEGRTPELTEKYYEKKDER